MRLCKLFVLLMSLFLVSCSSVSQAVRSGQPYTDQINWPDEYEPSQASFFIHNRTQIEAPPEIVWNILIQAETWPDWYEGAANVTVHNSNTGILEDGSVFTWKTMGLNFKSTVKEFVPPTRLSWESRKSSIRGYHAWLIIPTNGGSLLVTDEAQHGWLTFFQKVFQPNKLHKLHDIWLAEIKRKAEAMARNTSSKPRRIHIDTLSAKE